MKKSIISSLLLLSCSLHAVESKFIVRHREAGGVGYSKGYTSVDYFLTTQEGTEFLLDLRGHIFNDAHAAGNAGVGLRYPIGDDENTMIGANAFYDFREISHLFAHQASGGLEWLNKNVDFRVNGYYPFGRKRHLEHKSSFQGFAKHEVRIKRRLKSTLPSIDGEVGTPLPKPFYFAVGSYYLFEQETRGIEVGKAWGARLRAEVDLGKYVNLGLCITYDHIFKTRAQGILSVNIPLGWSPKKVKKTDETETPCYSRNLRQVPIMRNEIIPIQDKRKSRETLAHGSDPINFVFVDNTAPEPGDGSFEHPFSSLKEAEASSEPGDVIYVYPGDGTAKNMDQGIVLKEDQIIASSGAPLEVGDIVIPAQTTESPVITNVVDDQPVITNPGRSRLNDFIFIPPLQYLFSWFTGTETQPPVPAPAPAAPAGNGLWNWISGGNPPPPAPVQPPHEGSKLGESWIVMPRGPESAPNGKPLKSAIGIKQEQ